MFTYSKMIVSLKIIFLCSAIAILAILFIVSPPDDFGEPVKVSMLGLEKNITYQIIGARLRGASDQGPRFDFKADSIDPHANNSKNFSLVNLDGTVSFYDKDIFYISSRNAFVNTSERYVELSGNLLIKTKSGLSGRSKKIRIDLDSKTIISLGPVQFKTPLGMIYGGAMRISNSGPSINKTTSVFFEKGVKVNIR
jgi:hypothetical protein